MWCWRVTFLFHVAFVLFGSDDVPGTFSPRTKGSAGELHHPVEADVVSFLQKMDWHCPVVGCAYHLWKQKNGTIVVRATHELSCLQP